MALRLRPLPLARRPSRARPLARRQQVPGVLRAPLAMPQIALDRLVRMQSIREGQALTISRHLAKEESIREILLRRQATNLQRALIPVTHRQLQDSTGQMNGVSSTAAGHADQMRGAIKSATGKDEPVGAGEDSAGAQESPVPVRGSGSGSGSGSKSGSAAPTFASVNRGNPWAWSSYAPHPRRDGIATWGAYHAARVATKAAVTGRRAIDNAGKASD